VFPQEPRSNADEFVSPLRARDNVILTPHIGGSTQEAQRDIGTEVSSKLMKYSNNGSTLGAVNFPEVTLPAHPGRHRLLHIHRNQPGVLSELNSVFSQKGINIAGQYLQTNNKIGGRDHSHANSVLVSSRVRGDHVYYPIWRGGQRVRLKPAVAIGVQNLEEI
jgi:D-3-phosphoglycerate dehydrogenase